MASSIDDTKPVAGSALTTNVRANFTSAKAEIQTLQAIAISPCKLAVTTNITLSGEQTLDGWPMNL